MKFYANKLFTKKFYRSSIEKVDKTNEKEWKIEGKNWKKNVMEKRIERRKKKGKNKEKREERNKEKYTL